MKPLWLSDVSGLYQELYQPDTRSMTSVPFAISKESLNAGNLFWAKMLEPDRIVRVIGALEDSFLDPANQTPQFAGILADKELFVRNVLDARMQVCDQGLDPCEFFGKLETLAIACELYSRFETYPFRLTLHNGFLLSEVSAKDIVYNALSGAHNPYLPFIRETVFPLILEYSPDILFCVGRISYFHIAVARLLKQACPNVHICFTRHSSEYFSLNKIECYLKENAVLFSVVDSIIMEYFESSELLLINHLESQDDGEVPNILFPPGDTRNAAKRRPPSNLPLVIEKRTAQASGLRLSPERIADVHFEPNVKCYWNKCAFCGINKKYSHENPLQNDEQVVERVEALCNGVPNGSYLWFIDEAILPAKLGVIADTFRQNCRTFIWQARCRIDYGLLEDGLPERLACAGLTELRLGLESGSLRVLKLMNKFDDTFRLELVEKIVAAYSACGVAIHFPMIIGFPGEVETDRHLTYDFLASLQDKYPSLSFNINVFNLDVASPLFRQWDRFAVSEVAFPCAPSDFVGNLLMWNGPTKSDEDLLGRERDGFMRDRLYPWMPQHAMVTPAIFYRLSETIRNTLVWRRSTSRERKTPFRDKLVQRSGALVRHSKPNGEALLYNWDTHHYLEGGEILSRLLDIWESPKTIGQGIEALRGDKVLAEYERDIPIYLKKLVRHGHLVETGPEA